MKEEDRMKSLMFCVTCMIAASAALATIIEKRDVRVVYHELPPIADKPTATKSVIWQVPVPPSHEWRLIEFDPEEGTYTVFSEEDCEPPAILLVPMDDAEYPVPNFEDDLSPTP